MKERKTWIAKAWNWIEKTWKKIWNWIVNNRLLIVSIAIPVILIMIRFCYTEWFENIECKIGLEFYQIIVFVGALIGLVWTDKRYKQGQENLKQSEKSLKQSEEIAFKNKMNTQYLEVIKAISDKEKKKTPIVVNLINAIQASIAIFYDTEEKKKKAREEILNFRGMNLAGVHLIMADLKGADLKGANLTRANLTGADLTAADLTEADLAEADLRWANLTGADLTEANLRWANLTGADLRGANLIEAVLIEAVFAINSLNILSLNRLDSAKNVAEIKIYIHSKDKSYSLKEFVEMNPTNSITDNGKKLKKDIFDYFVELSKKN